MSKQTVRLNIEVTPEARVRIDDLKHKTGSTSLTEIYRRALTLYGLVVDNEVDGGRMVLEHGESREVVRLA